MMRKFILSILASFFFIATAHAYDTTAINGVVSAKSVNNVLHVGADTAWTGDIGAQINAAYAALPSTGGTIVIDPKTGGGCYSFTTPIVFATLGKFPLLVGSGPAGAGASSGTCLTFTPTSGAAITVDYALTTPPPAGGGITNVSISNGCFTTGGPGNGSCAASTAICLSVGTTNGGDWAATYNNLACQGFGKAYYNPSTLGVAETFYNPTFQYNNTVLDLGIATIRVFGGNVNANTYIVNESSTSSHPEIYWTELNSYNNTGDPVWKFGALTNPAKFSCSNCHFENSPALGGHYVSGDVNVSLFGGVVEDENPTGTGDWMFNQSGYFFEIFGTQIAAARPYTAIFDNTNPVRAVLMPTIQSVTTLPTMCSGTWASRCSYMPANAFASSTDAPWKLRGPVSITVLPANCTGQPTGTLWNNANVLNVCP